MNHHNSQFPIPNSRQPLIVVVGPTASGKTALTLQLAQRYHGEIICADSRTVYRGMNIGTAKPDKNQQKLVRHHCLDIINPNETYSAQQFQIDAKAAIDQIQKRQKIPVVVGGTGLYINALIYDYKFPSIANPEQRRVLEKLPLEDLADELKKIDSEAVKRVDLKNARRVIRAIETAHQPLKMTPNLPASYLLVGLKPGTEQLNNNIAQRTKMMIQNGLINEAKMIAVKYGKDIEPLNTVGYREALLFLEGQLSADEMEKQINVKTKQLVKKQMTWFKRDKNIRWFADGQSIIRALELEL